MVLVSDAKTFFQQKGEVIALGVARQLGSIARRMSITASIPALSEPINSRRERRS